MKDDFFEGFDRDSRKMFRGFFLWYILLLLVYVAAALGFLAGAVWIVIWILRMTGVL